MTPLYRTHDYASTLVGADTVHVSADVLGSDSIAYRRQPAAVSLRSEVVAELRSHHIPILVYTVNDRGPGSLAEHLAEIDVDGLFTDDPGGLLKQFDPKSSRPQRGPR